ncbi:MAG: NAD(P)-dependent glycerol-3-phosphate dehydrogenase [Clostridia bacterium]|nr:NAD(P)-dependent glycerol-3-phosphate dehydrogenase [Clostridia bacterium]MBQ2236957.1 NAD(P)-dependent glycerol-3-phosphate dehydrogenase [Clostridia bacterium]
MSKITVLGAGGWGMALAISAHNSGNEVTIWSPFENEVNLLLEKRTNEKLLKDVYLPKEINITNDMSCVEGSVLTIIATPSTAVRQVAKQLRSYKNYGIVVNVSKGIEQDSLKRLSEVIRDELGENARIVAFSGPSHAEEVARNIPTSIVAASNSLPAAQIVQDIMASPYLRIYTSGDIVGVELGGALKNVIAIAAGICDGMNLGDNTKAAMITRGLAEMARLGVCMGAKEYTFAGLTGIGDLIVTCTSKHSRNNRFGNKVGSGVSVEQALSEVGTVEGYYASFSAYNLAKKYRITMPIIEECYAILYENKDVKQVLTDLMNRPCRSEH